MSYDVGNPAHAPTADEDKIKRDRDALLDISRRVLALNTPLLQAPSLTLYNQLKRAVEQAERPPLPPTNCACDADITTFFVVQVFVNVDRRTGKVPRVRVHDEELLDATPGTAVPECSHCRALQPVEWQAVARAADFPAWEIGG